MRGGDTIVTQSERDLIEWVKDFRPSVRVGAEERSKEATNKVAARCDRVGYLFCIFLRRAIILGRDPLIF